MLEAIQRSTAPRELPVGQDGSTEQCVTSTPYPFADLPCAIPIFTSSSAGSPRRVPTLSSPPHSSHARLRTLQRWHRAHRRRLHPSRATTTPSAACAPRSPPPFSRLAISRSFSRFVTRLAGHCVDSQAARLRRRQHRSRPRPVRSPSSPHSRGIRHPLIAHSVRTEKQIGVACEWNVRQGAST